MAHTFNPTLRRQRQADLCEFEASLDYGESSRTARATWRKAVSKTKTNTLNFSCEFLIFCFLINSCILKYDKVLLPPSKAKRGNVLCAHTNHTENFSSSGSFACVFSTLNFHFPVFRFLFVPFLGIIAL